MVELLLLASLLLVFAQYFADGRSFDIFNPKNLFQIYYIIQLPLVLVIAKNFDVPGFVGLGKQSALYLFYKLGFLFFVGHFVFLSSYYSTGKVRLPSGFLNCFNWNARFVLWTVCCFFMLGYGAFLFLMHINGGYSAFVENRELWRAGGMAGQGWLIFPSTALLSMMAIAFVLSFPSRFKGAGGVVKFCLLIVLTILPASQMGFRGMMLLPCIQLLMAYGISVRAISFGRAVPFFLILVLLFTVYGIYREVAPYMPLGFDFDVALNFLSERPDFAFAIFLRSKGADVVSVVISSINDVYGYKFFYPMVYEAGTILIPSGLWSGKPVPLSVEFSSIFFGIPGGVSPTVVGEAYWHAGVLGVLVFMGILGSVFKIYINSMSSLKSGNNKTQIWLLIIIFPSLVMMAEAIQGYLNGIVMIFCFVLFLSFVFSGGVLKVGSRGQK